MGFLIKLCVVRLLKQYFLCLLSFHICPRDLFWLGWTCLSAINLKMRPQVQNAHTTSSLSREGCGPCISCALWCDRYFVHMPRLRVRAVCNNVASSPDPVISHSSAPLLSYVCYVLEKENHAIRKHQWQFFCATCTH